MRGAEGPLFVLVLGVMIALIVTLVSLARSQQQRQLLERIATRFQGRLEPGEFWTSQLRLKFQGYPALLRFVHVNKHTHTVFSITWPEDRLRCEIYPQDIFSGFRKLWGMEDIEIGSPQFDAAYFITSPSPNKDAIRELLNAEVQSVIVRLAKLDSANFFVTREIQVKWSGGLLTVTKPSNLQSFEALEQFLSLCSLLITAALQSRHTGIEFLSDAKEPDTAQAQCQVCGESLGGAGLGANEISELVYCASCDTPHHRDCWQYFGGCSTYACGGKNCLEQPKPQRRRKAS